MMEPSNINRDCGAPPADAEATTMFKKKVLIGIGGATLGLIGVLVPFIAPGFRKFCIPWMGTPIYIVRAALMKIPREASINTNGRGVNRVKRLVDLGSGDGRIVIEAARLGYDAVGIELNPWLVVYSYFRSWREGVLRKVSFRMVNFFHFDLTSFDVITCFGAKGIMDTLNAKIVKEAKHSSYVVCYRFPFTDKRPCIQDGELFIYRKSDL